MENKSGMIKFRIEKEKKDAWKKLCSERNVSLSRLIIDSVDNKLMNNDRREILAFIEKQDNFFVKIETNINQVAKIANSQKFLSEKQLLQFFEFLEEVEKLKKEQNLMFAKIYSIIAK